MMEHRTKTKLGCAALALMMTLGLSLPLAAEPATEPEPDAPSAAEALTLREIHVPPVALSAGHDDPGPARDHRPAHPAKPVTVANLDLTNPNYAACRDTLRKRNSGTGAAVVGGISVPIGLLGVGVGHSSLQTAYTEEDIEQAAELTASAIALLALSAVAIPVGIGSRVKAEQDNEQLHCWGEHAEPAAEPAPEPPAEDQPAEPAAGE